MLSEIFLDSLFQSITLSKIFRYCNLIGKFHFSRVIISIKSANPLEYSKFLSNSFLLISYQGELSLYYLYMFRKLRILYSHFKQNTHFDPKEFR